MNNISEATCWAYIPLIFVVVLVVVWNIIKRLTFIGGISKLFLTVSLSLLCLLLIGECVTMFSGDIVNLELHAEITSHPANTNPCVPFVRVITVAFMIIGGIFLIIEIDDCHMDAVEQFLGFSPNPEISEGKEKDPMEN